MCFLSLPARHGLISMRDRLIVLAYRGAIAESPSIGFSDVQVSSQIHIFLPHVATRLSTHIPALLHGSFLHLVLGRVGKKKIGR